MHCYELEELENLEYSAGTLCVNNQTCAGTGGSVLLPGLANNRVHNRSHKWSGPAAGKKVA